MLKNKEKIRIKLKNRRDKLSKAYINRASIEIFKSFKKEFSSALNKKLNIMVYLSTQSEVKTMGIIAYAFRKNCRLYVPSISRGKIAPLRLYQDSRLHKGSYRILEPVKKQKLSSLKKLDIIIVPGIGFDIKGNRIGFGRGYFDSFLRKTGSKALKIALAFSKQVEKKIPSAKHDVKMDYIITEKNILQIKK